MGKVRSINQFDISFRNAVCLFSFFLILEKLGEAIFKGRTHVEFEEELL